MSFTTPQTVWASAEGDAKNTKSTGRLPAGLSRKDKDAILRTIAEEWSTHCQHSYDCCGHWYRNCRAVITGRRITLYVGHRQNI
jgi:hypothetical protein